MTYNSTHALLGRYQDHMPLVIDAVALTWDCADWSNVLVVYIFKMVSHEKQTKPFSSFVFVIIIRTLDKLCCWNNNTSVSCGIDSSISLLKAKRSGRLCIHAACVLYLQQLSNDRP